MVLISGADNRDSEWQSVSLLPADKHTDESESAEALASLEHHLRWRETSLLVPRQPRASSSACSCIHNPFWVSYIVCTAGSHPWECQRGQTLRQRLFKSLAVSSPAIASDEFIQNSGELSDQRSPLRKEFTREWKNIRRFGVLIKTFNSQRKTGERTGKGGGREEGSVLMLTQHNCSCV